MKRKNPKYVQEFRDPDRVTPRYYLRKPGVKRVPLPGLPWSPEFMEAYQAGIADQAPAVGASRTLPGTVNAAIVGYYGSMPFWSEITVVPSRTVELIGEGKGVDQ